MSRVTHKRVGSLLLALFLIALTTSAALTAEKPSKQRTSPYLVRSAPGVAIKPILTVGDSVNARPDGAPYRMAGIPDGLGAFDNGDGTFTVLMNHEFSENLGAVRAHGATGAFVSKWIIQKGSLRVLHGEDLIQQVGVWSNAGWSYETGVEISRLCSADLPPVTAFFNPETGRGYDGRLLMNGEERGAEGLAYAHALDGVSYQLPWLGRFSWENNVAHPGAGDKTVVIGLDDSGDGQLYVYVGEKQSTGNAVERAGLANGELYGLKVEGYAFEDPSSGIPSGSAFSLHAFGNVADWSGAYLQEVSRANAVTEFQRPEDGAWDPQNPNDFYFVTTASFGSNASRLWRLRFVDPSDPAAGGTIEMLLDGSEGQEMMDNLTINERGQIFIQEDPGSAELLARVWRYDIAKDQLWEVAAHDPDRFLPGGAAFLTTNEESSGIIDVSDILGEGWFLADVQAHYDVGDAELVEGGQLLAIHVRPGRK